MIGCRGILRRASFPPHVSTAIRSWRFIMAGRDKGIIDPPIDALLEKVDSKYQLVIYASKRARQINDYYSDLHEGNLFDNVGPLVDSSVEDKPLTIALHEIHEDKLRLRQAE
jgi:DNA-directed RNA polymerase subunit omega